MRWGSRAWRGGSASFSKNDHQARPDSRNGRWGTMLIALRRGSWRSRAGHTSTQRRQPVQSSTDTWMVKDWPAKDGSRAGAWRKPSGAAARAAGSLTLARITAWGQTITHLPHWMQRSLSQRGTSAAMLRFSQRAVPVGKVPSQGRALTGRASPAWASKGAITSRTKDGAAAKRSGGAGSGNGSSRRSHGTGCSRSRVASTACRLRETTTSPLRA